MGQYIKTFNELKIELTTYQDDTVFHLLHMDDFYLEVIDMPLQVDPVFGQQYKYHNLGGIWGYSDDGQCKPLGDDLDSYENILVNSSF